MNVRHLLRALWRRRLVAAGLLAVTLLSTMLYLRDVPRLYTATASVAIVPGASETGFGALSGPLLGTLVDQARGNDILNAARAEVPGAPTLEGLRGATTVQAVTDAFTLRISVELEDPAMAAELANQIAKALPRFNLVPGQVAYRAVDVAFPPTTPTSPQVRLVLGVGVLLGVALAVAGALLVDDVRRQVETPEELATAVGAPLLGTVRIPSDPGSDGTQDRVVEASLRALRVGLSAAGAGRGFVVAGLDERDADVWLASRTAAGLATIHDRVLLVLASPHAPGPSLLATETDGLPGLAEALAGAEVQPLLRLSTVPGLWVLPAGQGDARLPTLLERGFATLLTKLATEYEVVVVAAPPLASGDDARLMATDGRILVWTRLGRTPWRGVRELVGGLRTVRAEVLGCVAVRPRGVLQWLRRTP